MSDFAFRGPSVPFEKFRCQPGGRWRPAQKTDRKLSGIVLLDKTTLMSQLDGLERRGLIVRASHPRDRRLRIPVITGAGADLRATVADACAAVEAAVLRCLGQDEVHTLRRMLSAVIGASEARGSCL
jgi:DNA-binding MarR family transcriptional regulator